jgi:DMSO/TMAO reductase YedYZ molybdopterin-dependent catalytic subunit
MPPRLSRRDALLAGIAGSLAPRAVADEPVDPGRKFLTPATKFEDVSRGNPVPHSLTGQALLDAKLTPETWQLEVVAEDKAKIAKPLTLSFADLVALGKTKAVRYLKAMQCNNIPQPLGQGLWEGVLLRDLLALAGPIDEARRLFYWGFHNNNPKQIFRSSLAMNQVLDAAPGDLPPFLAYKLNGEPIPLVRGGPVRMVVPWAHGFKSVKWLQKIVLTNKYDANDTYALAGNDPESYHKTAAYFDSTKAEKFPAGKTIKIQGTAMVGLPGLERVEYWLRADTGAKLTASDPGWKAAEWKPATIAQPPKDWSAELSAGYAAKDIWGFGADGKPKEWPMRYSVAFWSVKLEGLKPGKYELRVRSVDKNSFAQPEPRDGKRSGKNQVQVKPFSVE